MRTTVETKEMLDLLQEYFTEAMEARKTLGADDERARMSISWCIGMKEMVEALICAPVNLQMDGKVTVGYCE